jgi:hypothetical protein
MMMMMMNIFLRDRETRVHPLLYYLSNQNWVNCFSVTSFLFRQTTFLVSHVPACAGVHKASLYTWDVPVNAVRSGEHVQVRNEHPPTEVVVVSEQCDHPRPILGVGRLSAHNSRGGHRAHTASWKNPTYEGVTKSIRTESITKYTLTTVNTLRSNTKGYGGKTH